MSAYIGIFPLRDGTHGHFRHLVHVHIQTKRMIPLTHGRFEVRKLVHWDQNNNFVYFLGTPENFPGQLHLYRTSSLPPTVGAAVIQPHCLTCTTSAGGYETTTRKPPKLATSWDDDWEEEQPIVTSTTTQSPPPKKKKKKGEN